MVLRVPLEFISGTVRVRLRQQIRFPVLSRHVAGELDQVVVGIP